MSWYKPLLDKRNTKNKGSKYNSQKTQIDGYWFASKAEGALYDALKVELTAGVWRSIHCQVSVYLTSARILYKPDFLCIDPNGKEVYMEMKGGMETSPWRIKRRLWMYYGCAELQIWNYDHRNKKLIHRETINPKAEPGTNPP